MGRNARHRRADNNSNPVVIRDTRVKKVFVKSGPRKVIRQEGPKLLYRPKEVRFVYRDLRKKVVLRTHDWDTRIKYISGKGKDLNILKQKIVILEDQVKRKHKRKKH